MLCVMLIWHVKSIPFTLFLINSFQNNCAFSFTFTSRPQMSALPQGPKLTFLGRHQLATEILIEYFLLSETQVDGKFWSPIFLLRIRTKRTSLGPFPLTNKIKCKHAGQASRTPAIYAVSFVRLPNVSSQLYTFSYGRLKTAVWFFSLCSKRSFLSCSVKT